MIQTLFLTTTSSLASIKLIQTLSKRTRYVSDSLVPAKSAFVGLSAARTPGSWQIESKVLSS